MNLEQTLNEIDKAMASGKRCVILTPDDILTLKLLREDYRKPQWANYEWNRIFQTLERILKQVG
jgi:hypothetical protein